MRKLFVVILILGIVGLVVSQSIGKRFKKGKCNQPNETWKRCKSTCPETCEGQSRICTRICTTGCDCIKDYVRETLGGPCIPKESCPE